MEGLRKLEKVCEILEQNKRDPSRLIPILQAVQEEYRYLPEEVLTFVATSLNLTPARVYGVATFYSHFTLKPKGKYVIRICDGTASHVKKSTALLDAMRKKTRVKEKRKKEKRKKKKEKRVKPACSLQVPVHHKFVPQSRLKREKNYS